MGRSFRREESADKPDTLFLVVGLVRNTKYYELREDFRPIAFVSESQDGPALAAWAGQAAASLIYGLKPRDPATLGGAVGLLAVAALVASYGPAWRASRLQPMEALRDE